VEKGANQCTPTATCATSSSAILATTLDVRRSPKPTNFCTSRGPASSPLASYTITKKLTSSNTNWNQKKKVFKSYVQLNASRTKQIRWKYVQVCKNQKDEVPMNCCLLATSPCDLIHSTCLPGSYQFINGIGAMRRLSSLLGYKHV
jgi:hypothetical protein